MLNAKLFDKLFGKTLAKRKKFGKYSLCLANTILFGKLIEPIKQFGIQHDYSKQFVKLFEVFSGSVLPPNPSAACS